MKLFSSVATAALLGSLATFQISPVNADVNSWWHDLGVHVNPFFCRVLGKCRRRLGGVVEVELSTENILNEEGWKSYKENCQSHDYELQLYVDSHLFLIATPANNEETNCNSLVFHATASKSKESAAGLEKQILHFENDPTLLAAIEKESISLDTHNLKMIAHAFDHADANAPKAQNSDIVKNNCGDFVKHFGSLLRVKVTPELTAKIAKRLYQKGGMELINKIRENKHVDMLGGKDESDEDLIKHLVELRTGDLYN